MAMGQGDFQISSFRPDLYAEVTGVVSTHFGSWGM